MPKASGEVVVEVAVLSEDKTFWPCICDLRSRHRSLQDEKQTMSSEHED